MSDSMSSLSLSQWLCHLQTLHLKDMDFNLDRLRPLVAALGITSFDCPVITVAGTNGKGSVVALLSAAYQTAGLRVASTTSPHLLRINERACINAEQISDQDLVAMLQYVEAHRDGLTLTYFEFLAFAFLCYFKRQSPDVVILEVGLGGRLDMMNVVANDCAVITSIALDHVQQLGPTRALIAKEKCGVYRAKALAVCGDPSPPNEVMSMADALACKLYCLGRDYHVIDHDDGTWTWQMPGQAICMPAALLKRQNLATALSVVHIMSTHHALPGLASVLPKQLAAVALPGRQQCLQIGLPYDVSLLLDVAHNAHSAMHLYQSVMRDIKQATIHMVFAALQSKDIVAMLHVFAPCRAVWHVAPIKGQASVLPNNLTAKLSDIGQRACYSYESVSEALKAACLAADSNDKVVVWGSFHTVEEALLWLDKENVSHA
jgi:dihydrofolate synthase / folylpolyglutamate synthase